MKVQKMIRPITLRGGKTELLGVAAPDTLRGGNPKTIQNMRFKEYELNPETCARLILNI